MTFPKVRTLVCIREPNEGAIRSAEAAIHDLRHASYLSLALDSKLIVPRLQRDLAFKKMPQLAEASPLDWLPILGPHFHDDLLNAGSTPMLMASSLLLKMEIEIFHYLELQPFNFTLISEKMDDVIRLKEQFKAFLIKRFTGGKVFYSKTGYETRFLNLMALSAAITGTNISYEDLFNSLVELYQASLLGAMEVNWADERIYSNYFVPMHLPTNARDRLKTKTAMVWQLIKGMR